MQAVIQTIGVAIPTLSAVINLFLILFTILGLSGVLLFGGAFSRRCVLPFGPGITDYTYANPPWFCGDNSLLNHKSKVRVHHG